MCKDEGGEFRDGCARMGMIRSGPGIEDSETKIQDCWRRGGYSESGRKD